MSIIKCSKCETTATVILDNMYYCSVCGLKKVKGNHRHD